MNDKKLALLVGKAIDGDIEAFEEVYFEHAQAVLFHVRNQIIDKENYQDVAQDVALTLWKNIGQLRKPAAFRGWMHQVIRTSCISHNRTLLKEREKQSNGNNEEIIDELPTVATGEEGDPALLNLKKDDERQLFAAIEALPPAYREAITLRYYDDLSYKEIATVLGISTSAVGTNIKRGTEHLKKTLAGEATVPLEEHTRKEVSLHKGEDMQEQDKKKDKLDTGGTVQRGAAVAGAFAVSDESIRRSLETGVGELLPPEVVEFYTKQVHALLTGAQVVTATALGTGAVVATAKAGGTALITAVTAVIATAALAVGAYGYSQAGAPGITTWSEIKSVEKTIYKDIQYSGDPRILFESTRGANSPYEVTGIAVADNLITPASITWTVVSSGGEQVLAGEGAMVVGLEGLAAGEYKVNFTLTDEQGATAHSSRTFTLGAAAPAM